MNLSTQHETSLNSPSNGRVNRKNKKISLYKHNKNSVRQLPMNRTFEYKDTPNQLSVYSKYQGNEDIKNRQN